MPQISRGRALAYVVLLLAVLTFAGRAAFRTEGEAAPAVPPLSLRAEPPPAGKLLVHVVGAVRSPGLYELDEGSRIDDAITAAGGPKPKAALDLVNLASPVADGQQVALPLRGTAEEAAAPGSPANSVSGTRVHLNTATLEDLDSLPGIGPITAQKILDYRAEHGAFSSVDELDAVSGIGPATLAELRELVDL
jgi:competence protein ComEA